MEDEDEYLYGDEAPESKKLKSKDIANAAEVELYGKDDEDVKMDQAEPRPQDEEDDEEDEESDIEFVIDTRPGQRAEPPPRQEPYSQVKTEASKEEEPAAAQEKAAAPKLDINAIADHNGTPITQVVLENLEEKPWRKPGADITDYFNYGFDEFTWTAYCSKQDNLREDFNPQKLMSQMMGMMPMFPPEMMGQMGFPPQGFPGMPQGFPQGLPQDMMQMGMMGMPGFMPPNQQQQKNDAYGGNNVVQGVAGMVANPNVAFSFPGQQQPPQPGPPAQFPNRNR